VRPFQALGAAALFGSLFLRWYVLDPRADLRFPGDMHYLDVWPTAWHVFTVVDVALAVLAVLAVRFRAAAVAALVVILVRLAVPLAGYLDPSVGAGLALGGALLAATAPSGPAALARVGGIALLASLFAPWYHGGVFITPRAPQHSAPTISPPGRC
jgi:hypothetical protein